MMAFLSKLVITLRRVRGFLTNNKVFFEIFVISSLSMMALIVSIKANEIAELHLTITKSENMPQFEIYSSQIKNEIAGIYDYSEWNIVNKGGRFSDLSLSELSFVTYKKWGAQDLDTRRIPVYAYLSMRRTASMENEGVVYSFNNDRNDSLTIQLKTDLQDEGYLDVEIYVMISYTDFLGEPKVEYRRLDTGFNKISEEHYKRLDSTYSNSKRIYFAELTPQIIKSYNSGSF